MVGGHAVPRATVFSHHVCWVVLATERHSRRPVSAAEKNATDYGQNYLVEKCNYTPLQVEALCAAILKDTSAP